MGKMALRPKLKIAQSLNYCYIYKSHKYLSNITQIKEENDLKGLSTMWWTQTFKENEDILKDLTRRCKTPWITLSPSAEHKQPPSTCKMAFRTKHNNRDII